MFGVGDPGAHPLLDFFALHPALTPARAQPPQAVAKAAHVFFRQAAASVW